MPNELHIPAGTRVRLRESIGDYPISPCPAGSTGTVLGVRRQGLESWLEVKMDRRFPDLAEWDNVLWVRRWLDGETWSEQISFPAYDLLEVIPCSE